MTRGGGANFDAFSLYFSWTEKVKRKFISDKYKKKKKKKKLFHLVLKISAIPPVLCNREITGIFNTFDDIYLVFTSKK